MQQRDTSWFPAAHSVFKAEETPPLWSHAIHHVWTHVIHLKADHKNAEAIRSGSVELKHVALFPLKDKDPF